MLAIEREILQSRVAPVRYRNERLSASRIDPDAMRTIELSGLFAFASPGAYVLRFGIVLMNPTQAVTVGDINIPVRSDGHVGRFVLIFVFVRGAFTRIAQDPKPHTIESGFGHQVPLRIGQVQVLCATLFAQEHAVGSGFEVFAPALYELAVAVEDCNGVPAAIVNDDSLLRIHRHAVRVSVLAAIGERAPIAYEFIGV